MSAANSSWFLYVLLCRDGSFYCGITNNVARRLRMHENGKAARYTRGRRPVSLLKVWPMDERSAALRAEAAFKKLSRPQKELRLQCGPLF
jgi:putative endonuclease